MNFQQIFIGVLGLGFSTGIIATYASDTAAEAPQPAAVIRTVSAKPLSLPLPDSAALDRAEMATEIQAILAQAQQLRADYLAQKAELLKTIRQAEAQTRETIRARLRDNRQQFLAAQREHRAELRNRIQEIRETLPAHSDIVDDVKERIDRRKAGE